MNTYISSRLNFIGSLFIIILCYLTVDQAFYLAADALSMKGDFWLTADWVINYSNGFIRRGLLGEILLKICQFLNLDLIKVTINLQLLLIILFVILSLILYFKTTKTFVEKAIFCSPAFYIGFCYWTPRGGFRKELILVTIFALLVVIKLLFKNKLQDNYYVTFSLLLYTLFGLTHEMIIFFSPLLLFFFFILYTNKLISLKSVCFICITICLINIILFLLSYLFHGDPASSAAICKSVSPYTISVFCNGAISALGKDLNAALEGISFYIKNTSYLVSYPLLLVLAFLPFTMITYNKELKVKYGLLVSFICLLPLFVIAVDWGRWISTYTTIFSLITFFLLHTKQARIKPFFQQHTIFSACLFVIYTFTWVVPFCCIYAFPKSSLIIKVSALL